MRVFWGGSPRGERLIMCGIAGQFGVISPEFFWKSLERLRHRGPDDKGVWEGDRAVLVHTRLAIIDLSDAGRQPMLHEERSLSMLDEPTGVSCAGRKQPLHVLVFNGEIYNHAELRKDLEAQGQKFTGHSDTEVLLRLLVREGADCLPRLAGMFAFAYWNVATETALLARDALGIKPLYYRAEADSFAFASEVHVLGKPGDIVDPDALRDYFLWGSFPESQTWLAEINQLPAGHFLEWRDGQCTIEHWHSVTQSEFRILNSKSSATLTREALLESMRRHLVSDVPIGIFLSGGIDSTVILALAREVLGREADIRTFSIGFDNQKFDESSVARLTATHFGAHHCEWIMTAEEGVSEIPQFLAAVDQPSIDGFNTWCVSKLARREGLKVVLSGLGGDEWFAGYPSFSRVPAFRRSYQLMGPLRSSIARVLKQQVAGSPWCRLGTFFDGSGSWLEAFHAQRGIFTPEEAGVLAECFSKKSAINPNWDVGELPEDPRLIVGHLEITRYMRNQLLRDSDVFSMAHGLELRVPFVDVRLAETLNSIVPHFRLRQGKKLLLDAVPEVPEWVWKQPKKGFRFPFQEWMNGSFKELLSEAEAVSPIELRNWYRIWAVSNVLLRIRQLESSVRD